MILFKTLNSGNTFWPAGLVVKMKKGNLHDLKKKKNEIVSEQGVGSGMTYDWMLKLKAPKNPGTYSAEFEMYTEQGAACKNYGSKIKFDIQVEVVNNIKPVVAQETYTAQVPN